MVLSCHDYQIQVVAFRINFASLWSSQEKKEIITEQIEIIGTPFLKTFLKALVHLNPESIVLFDLKTIDAHSN